MLVLSFVIPMYNASSTILRCLDSIYGLPVEESFFEVIAIDDCSTDNTVELVKEYAHGHSNLVLLCQPENHKQGAARNRGVSVARGTFIAFVDSDDETDKGVVSAVRLASDKNLDMVAIKTATFSKYGEFEKATTLPYAKDAIFSGIELQTEHPFWFAGPVAYLYRFSFIKNINYPFAEGVFYEDSDFVNVHLYYAKRMAYCDECGYRIHQDNSISTTQTLSAENCSDYFLLGVRMLGFYECLCEKTVKYAESILEGGSYCIMKAFRRLFRLKSISEVCTFYDSIDTQCDRELLLKYNKPAYCWTHWTRFCIKHRRLSVVIIGLVISFKKFVS